MNTPHLHDTPEEAPALRQLTRLSLICAVAGFLLSAALAIGLAVVADGFAFPR